MQTALQPVVCQASHYLLSDIEPLQLRPASSLKSQSSPLPLFPVKGLPPTFDSQMWKGRFMQDPAKTVLPSAPVRSDAKALPLEWILNPSKGLSFSDRVLARLVQSEAHEVDPHLRDDYRQSFITVSLASKGNTVPFVAASYQMYGLHPDKVWPAIVARRAAMLGPSGESGVTLPGSPKKPSQSVKSPAGKSEKNNASF